MMSKTKQTCFVFFVIALTTLCCLTSTSDAFSPAQANMRGSVKPIVNIPKSKVDRPRVQPIAPRKPGAPPSAFHPGRNNNGNLPAMSMESNNNNKNNNMGMESLVMQESEVEKKWKATMPDFSDLFGEKKTPDFKIPSGKEFMTAAIAAGVVMGGPTSALAVPVDGKVLTPIEQLQEPPSQYVPRPREIKYNDLVDKTVKDELTAARFTGDGKSVTVLDVNGKRFSVAALEFDPNLLNIMEEHNVDTLVATGTQAKGDNVILNALSNFIVPGFILLGVFALLRRNAAGGGMGGPNPFQMGKSVAKIQMEPDTNTNFEDVAGCDEAKEELVEVVDFLKNTEKYAKLGATIPRGVILEGPPGTGKTLLARAVAGEAGVPFFSVSGSEFVEMFVGVGASRVRDLFKQAKENAPCIIFIDEIDAVGRQRSAGGGMMGGNDEREQTLNQILTEMDGFEGNAGVVVMAATNRADVLDNALLRPGRFDRRVGVNLADFAGRVAILNVHARNKPFAADVDLEGVARRTVGFSGAQLQNLLNEAAIYAARDGAKEITYKNIDDALDRLLVGLAKKNRDAQPLETKRLVALHEAGHAIVGALTPGYDDVQKVTIIPRSNGAGGLTFFAPSEDRVDSGLYSRIYLEGAIAVALGGRVAEELFYDKGGVTTGASSDLQQVASTARNMVTQWGMTNVIPPLATGAQQGQPEAAGQWSTEVQEAIDEEIFIIVNNAYATARGILVDHEHLVRELADKLIEKETVDEFEVKELVKDDIEKMNKERYRAYRETSMPVIKTLPSAMEEIEKIEEENRYKSIIELNNLLTPENIEKAKQFVSAEDIAALEELTQTE